MATTARLMQIVDSSKMDLRDFNLDEKLWLYCGLDSAILHEIKGVTKPQLNKNTARIYKFELAQRAPALVMMHDGIRVHPERQAIAITELLKVVQQLQGWLNELGFETWGKPLNAKSSKQKCEFFYEYMRLPKQYNFEKGKRKLTADRKALEKLEVHFWAGPIVRLILEIQDLSKRASTLASATYKGRMYFSFGPSATETGRWNSTKNCYAGGTNGQNLDAGIEDPKDPHFGNPAFNLRMIFIADDGWKFGNVDLEQAESRGVAYLSGDDAYIEACESGDLHSQVARWVFGISEQQCRDKYYRNYTYRDMAKRCGHATNYYGKPFAISKILHLPERVVQEFQTLYFRTFPGIPKWHMSIATELQTRGKLITPLGRERNFYGRLNDDATLREGIAYKPQSLIVDTLNIGLMRVWNQLSLKTARVRLMQQGHDSILFQYPVQSRSVPVQVQSLMSVTVPIGSREMTIPVELKAGFDWHNLAKWGTDEERGQKRPTIGKVLDRLVS